MSRTSWQRLYGRFVLTSKETCPGRGGGARRVGIATVRAPRTGAGPIARDGWEDTGPDDGSPDGGDRNRGGREGRGPPDEGIRWSDRPEEAARAGRQPPPWPVRPQLLVAILGGVPAVTVVAWENARRLGVPRARRWGILIVGLAGLGVVVALGAFAPIVRDDLLVARILARVVAVAVFLLQRGPQLEALGGEEPPARRMLVPAGIATVLGALLQVGLLAAVALPRIG